MSRTTLSVAAMLVVGALACQPAGEASDPERAADATAPEGEPITLASVNRSGIRGQVRMEREGDEVEVRVDLEGLSPGSPYAVHLLEGRCAEEGQITVALGDAVGSQGGVGRVSKEFPSQQLPSGRSYFVQVHDPEGNALACGDLDSSTAADTTAQDTPGDTAGAAPAGSRRAPEIERR